MTHASFKRTGQWIQVDLNPGRCGSSRLGILVTKRFGGAVKRNRFKRLVRDSFRLASPSFPRPFDILVRPRSQALLAHRADVQVELARFIAEATTQFCER